MSASFGQAAASYFGLDPERATEALVVADGVTMELQVRIVLTDADIIGVTDRMKELAAAPLPEVVVDEQGKHLYMPTVQEAIRNPHLYAPRPECAEVMERAAKLSAKVREAISAYEAKRESVGANDKEVEQ